MYYRNEEEDAAADNGGGNQESSAIHGAGPFPGSGPVGGNSAGKKPAGSSSRSTGDSSKRFATLSDITQGTSDNADSPAKSGSDDDDENLFTGGEKSGLAVQNPDDVKGSRLIDNIFRQAAKPPPDNGGGEDETPESSNSRGAPGVFTGTGSTLGSDNVPSQEIRNPEEPKPKKKVTRRLTFWKDGFSVEDGPLYRYDDPANVHHLQAINSGTAPLSLLQVEAGESVDVHIIRKMEENYTAPKPKPGGFQGQGTRLGSPVPGDFSSPSSTAPPATQPQPTAESSSSGAAATTTAASSHYGDGIPGVGDAIIMIRLADGRNVKVRFTNSGFIQQIYDYINLHYPTDREYILHTTFPITELRDKSSRIEDHKLKGAVVVQKYI